MKKLLLPLLLSLVSLSTSLGANPIKTKNKGNVVKAVAIFKTAEVEFYMAETAASDFFSHAGFNTETDNVEFVTKDEIKYLQIFNQKGKLQYQLPVMSNKLKISRKMFNTGVYKIGFIVQGGNNIEFSNLKFN